MSSLDVGAATLDGEAPRVGSLASDVAAGVGGMLQPFGWWVVLARFSPVVAAKL